MAQTDVFAVGAILYEAISGTPAFPGNTLHEKVQAVFQGGPPPLNWSEGPELDAILARALASNPKERYPSASSFLTDLKSLGQTERHSWLPVTLAVLDFQDLSGGEEGPDWIATALPEALASSLTGIEGITQIPREKVAAMRAAGGSESSELDIGLRVASSAVLYGSIKRSGDELRANAKLSDTATGALIFEDVVKGTEDEVLAMPDRFTPAVAELFGGEVPQAAKQSIMTEAHKYYVEAYRGGAQAGGRGEFERSVKLAERAVELVPDYGIALAFLAVRHGMSFNFTSDPKVLETAVDYAQRALNVDPELADAHLGMGYALRHQEKHLAGYRSFLQAMRLDPSSFFPPYFAASSLLLAPMDQLMELVEESRQTSRPDDVHRWRRLEGVQLLQRSLKLNPKLSWAWLGLGWTQVELGRFNEARWCLNKAVELEPTSVPRVAGCAGYLAECLRRSGKIEEAKTKFVEALEELERTDHMYRDTFRGFFLCGLGRAALDQADEDAATAAFTQAVLHIRGRSAARCGGHVLVQALAGLTRAGGGADHFEEARTLFETRADFNFGEVWGCSDAIDLLELARAAEALGRDEAETLFEQAREMGSSEALAREDSGP